MFVIKKSSKRILFMVGILLILMIVIIVIANHNTTETTIEDVAVEKVDIQQTLTAAGEIKGAQEQTVEFSTSKVFRAVCVEEDDFVKKGDAIIEYADGTYTTATKSGIVESIDAPQNGSIADSSNCIRINNIDTLQVNITVPESEINEITVGNAATIIANSDESKTYTATIKSKKAVSTTLLLSYSETEESMEGVPNGAGTTDSSAGETSYYTVILQFKNDGSLRPGMSAVSTMIMQEKEQVIAVPVEAVQYDGDETYVNVVKGNTIEQTMVTIGISDADYVEIVSGLDGSETVRIER